MIKKKGFSLLFLLISFSVLFPLDTSKRINQYLIDTWTNKNGLPQNYVSTVIQTKQGYIWIGTQEGVVKFDGVNMITYSSNNISEFKNNIITDLLEDDNNNLWIATLNGLIRYNNGKFRLFTTKDGLINNLVRCLKTDNKGVLWIGTDQGICSLKNDKFKKYIINKSKSNNYINSIVGDIKNNLLIATKEEIFRFKKDKFSPLNISEYFENEISVIYVDRSNILYVGTLNKGLFKYINNKLIEVVDKNKDKISGSNISSIIEDSNGNLWIGTANGGLSRIYNNKIDSFTKKNGLPSNYILELFEDREHNIWIGSALAGLTRMRDGKVTVFRQTDGITSVNVRTTFEDSKYNLWVGTGDGGLYKKQDHIFIDVDYKKKIAGSEIRSIMEDAEGNIWIGTLDSGLFIIKDNIITRSPYNSHLSGKGIYALFKSSDKSMWIGTTSGITRYKEGTFKQYTKINNTKLTAVRTITEDKTGNILFSVEGMGLAKFQNNRLSFLTKNLDLNSNIITCLYSDSNNIIWVGTYGEGLSWIINNKIYKANVKDGLFSNSAYTIVEYNNRLWMSCNNGIYNVSKQELLDFGNNKISSIKCRTFNESSGMINRECNGGNYPVAWKDNKGILWFPNVKGLVKIDPKNIKPNKNFPQLIIEKIIVDEQDIKIKDNTIISPGYKRIEFKYTALEFTNPRAIKFKVKLKGVENKWINMGTARKTYYTLIPPGKYVFEVLSTNGEGKWNTKSTKINIILKPFFYQTKVFYVFILVILIILIILFIRLRLNSLNKKKIELEKEIKKRTIEIRQKNVELEKLSIVARETDNGIIITDIDGTILWVNEGFERMYGYSLEEFIKIFGENVKKFSVKSNFEETITQCITNKETIRYERENKTKENKSIWVQTSLTPVFDESGNTKELIFVETDVTKLKKAYNKMREMSLTDQLTKLKNRRYFHNLIDRDIQIAKRKLYKRTKEGLIYSMIFLMVDIDFFKKVNDTYGHNAGDQLLVQISNRMKDTIRTSDLIVRWGGEEFLIMTKDDNFEGARLLSLRLLNAIENEKFNLEGIAVSITISIGFCGFPIISKKPNQFGWEDIVQLADTALYIAKDNGRRQSVGVKLLDEELTEENCNIVKSNFEEALRKNIVEVISSTTDKD